MEIRQFNNFSGRFQYSSGIGKTVLVTIQALEHTNQLDLTDIYRVLHNETVQYTFYSTANTTFSKTIYYSRDGVSIPWDRSRPVYFYMALKLRTYLHF